MDKNTSSEIGPKRYIEICSLCLSTDRRLQNVSKTVLFAYGLITDWASIRDVLICWECNKRLGNVQQFKLQVKQAREQLEAYINDPTHQLQCLSNLIQTINNTNDRECTENNTNTYESGAVKDDWMEDLHLDNIWTAPVFCPSIDKEEFEEIKEENKESYQCGNGINSNSIEENVINVKTEKNEIEIRESWTEVILIQNEKINSTCLNDVGSRKEDEVIINSSENIIYINSDGGSLQRKDNVITIPENEVIAADNPESDASLPNEHISNVAICERTSPIRIMLEKSNLSAGIKTKNVKTPKKRQGKVEKCKKFTKKEIFDYARFFKITLPTKEEYDSYLEYYFKRRRSNFKCVNCVKSIPTRAMLESHMKKFHYEHEDAHRCDGCTCSFASGRELGLHRRKHGPFRVYSCLSDGCGYVHHYKTDLKKHVMWHRKMQEDKYHTETFECDICGMKYNERRKMATHISKHWKRCVCETCGFTTNCPSKLKLHNNSHLGPEHRKFECTICSKKFFYKSKLQEHERIHRGEKTPCEICGCAFTNKYELKKHRLKMHNIVTETRRIVNTPRTKPLFNSRHEGAKTGKVKQQRLRCNQKMQIFKENPSTLGERPENKLYDCPVCNKSYKRYKIQVHYRDHTDERPFECAVCSKRFKQKTNLALHMPCHSEERNHKCDVCGATFKKHANLYTHKLIHRSDKPHGCSVCGAKFVLKGNMTAHMKIHTGDKPFECAVCGKRFMWRKNLAAHAKVHPGMNVFKNSSDVSAEK